MTEHEREIRGVPASIIVETVEAIEREHGLCHPAMLVEAAVAESSPLHPLFDWDDTEAAKRWRTHQARNVINSLRVVVENREEPTIAFIAVTRVTDDGVEHGYVTAQHALTTEYRSGVLRDALAQLRGLQRRYAELGELETLWTVLDEIEEGERAAA